MERDVAQLDADLFDRLPRLAIEKILQFLRLPEIVALAEIFPRVDAHYSQHVNWMNNKFERHPAFRWIRCAPSDSDEVMASRRRHCTVHLPSTNSVYCFGGEVIGGDDSETRRASFNDFWRFDLAARRWSRVNVTRPPYPLPKCDASMVEWSGRIVLFGGYHPLPPGNILRSYDSSQSEMHIFDPETNCWTPIIPANEGPCLSGHSAVVCRNSMIVYGGWSENNARMGATTIHVFDFVQELWRSINLYPQRRYTGPSSLVSNRLQPGERFFPPMHATNSTIVLIRDGLLLITGEMDEFDYGSSILVEFDPLDISATSNRWRWKRVETIGRWWNARTIDDSPNTNCSMPNFCFYQVAAITNGQTVRLTSLGRIEGDRQVIRNNLTVRYEATQKRCREFVRFVRQKLEAEFEKRNENIDDDFKTSFNVDHDATRCQVLNCFLPQEKLRKLRIEKPEQLHSMDTLRIRVRTIKNEDSNSKDWDYDDVDLWEMRVHLRAMISQLHAKYYPGRIDESMCAHLPMRNHIVRRLAVYTVDIPTNVNFDEFDGFRWNPQHLQYRAAPVTTDYSFTSAHHEIIMHGGCFVFNESMRRMGHTYILQLTRSAPPSYPVATQKPSLWARRS